MELEPQPNPYEGMNLGEVPISWWHNPDGSFRVLHDETPDIFYPPQSEEHLGDEF